MDLWKKFLQRWWKIEKPVWINELPENEQETVRKVRSLLVMIGDSWVLYPLWAFVAIAMVSVFMIMQFGGNLPDLGYSQLKIGLIIGVIISLVGLPLSKLIFLKHCQKLLARLEEELKSEEGWHAYNLIKKKESSLTQIEESANRRYLFDWFSFLYHYTDLDRESKRAKRS